MTSNGAEGPDLYAAIDPLICQSLTARNRLVEEMAMLELRISEITQCRASRQPISLALAAEQLARTAFQVREISLSIHRTLAKRLNLEVRI